MHDRRGVAVEVVEGAGGLLDVVHHRGPAEPRRTARLQVLRQIDALHPVHHHHVLIVVEEVGPDDR